MDTCISVIVPVYNTEKYLKRCIDSIINQTYKNLEIIIVDDGSEDNSPEICDKYAEADSRIKVIHKKNGGVSAARNSALDIASGKYSVFVDSDDYIAPEMILRLLNNAINFNADISVCGMITTESEDSVFEENSESVQTVFSSEEALESFAENTVKVYEGKIKWEDIPIKSNSCDKMIKTEIIKAVGYPEGKICEDLLVIEKILSLSEKTVTDTYKGYYYYQRPGSIMHSDKYYKTEDDFEAYYNMKEAALKKYQNKRIAAMICLIICRVSFEKYKYLYKKDKKISCKHLVKNIRRNLFSVLKNSDVKINEKLVYLSLVFFPVLIRKKIG